MNRRGAGRARPAPHAAALLEGTPLLKHSVGIIDEWWLTTYVCVNQEAEGVPALAPNHPSDTDRSAAHAHGPIESEPDHWPIDDSPVRVM